MAFVFYIARWIEEEWCKELAGFYLHSNAFWFQLGIGGSQFNPMLGS